MIEQDESDDLKSLSTMTWNRTGLRRKVFFLYHIKNYLSLLGSFKFSGWNYERENEKETNNLCVSYFEGNSRLEGWRNTVNTHAHSSNYCLYSEYF